MNISLSTVVLFALVVPFIVTFSLSAGDPPYWLFGIIFLLLLVYVVLDILKLSKEAYVRYKTILLCLIIATTLGAGFLSTILLRHKVSPVYQVHDIILQQEAAIRFLLDGINPYATTYFGTLMEAWNYSDTEVNPALYHFVMQPFYLIFALPFYAASLKAIGYFDARIPLYLLFFAMLFLAFKLVRNTEKKFLFVTLLAFNPATLAYLVEGRSDFFMYAFLFAGWLLLQKERLTLAGIPMALAFAVKQNAWPLFPLYIGFLYFRNKSISKTLKQLSLFIVTFTVIVLPFFAWDPKAFLDSTVFYLSGNAERSYPISGYGFGMVLYQFGVIKDLNDPFSFTIIQLVIGLPLLAVLFRILKRHNSVRTMIIMYGIFLFVYWYFSRYFNNSHIGYLSTVFITAYFWPDEKEENNAP